MVVIPLNAMGVLEGILNVLAAVICLAIDVEWIAKTGDQYVCR